MFLVFIALEKSIDLNHLDNYNYYVIGIWEGRYTYVYNLNEALTKMLLQIGESGIPWNNLDQHICYMLDALIYNKSILVTVEVFFPNM